MVRKTFDCVGLLTSDFVVWHGRLPSSNSMVNNRSSGRIEMVYEIEWIDPIKSDRAWIGPEK
jgi:hypothetical protein